MSATISICGWENYQHYKDRDPPWIKLYRDVLTTEAWVLGTDQSRLVQVASTLLAARYRNEIPLNFTLLRKVASLDLSEADFGAAVSHLQQHKFLEIKGDSEPIPIAASTALATCATSSSAPYSEQSRAETEGDKNPPSGGVGGTLAQNASTMLAKPNTSEAIEPDPPGLDADAAARFIEYRRKRKPAIKPESMAAFKRSLAKYGERQAEVVEHSIANGYQGLIEPKQINGSITRKPYTPSPTTAELEAREAARGTG